MTLKQHAQSLYELGMQFKEMNTCVKEVSFEIRDADPNEMKGFEIENKRELSAATLGGKDYIKIMAQPIGDPVITIWIYSRPVKIKRSPDWELIDEKPSVTVAGNSYRIFPVETENVGELQPEQTTSLTPFTSDLAPEEENELLSDILGGIKYQ